MNAKDRMKDDKNKANMFYSYFSDIEGENNKDNKDNKDKDKTTSSINTKNKIYNIPSKKVKKEETYDIENEKDIDKVITALLLDKNLMKDNESMNRLLANENGVKKDVRYKLLQLENPVSKNIKRVSSNSNKIITSSNKSAVITLSISFSFSMSYVSSFLAFFVGILYVLFLLFIELVVLSLSLLSLLFSPSKSLK